VSAEDVRIVREDVQCVPLCGASKAYGRFDQPWKHEPECPVRIAWKAERQARVATEESRER